MTERLMLLHTPSRLTFEHPSCPADPKRWVRGQRSVVNSVDSGPAGVGSGPEASSGCGEHHWGSAELLLTRWAAARPATGPSFWWPSAPRHPAGEREEHKNFTSAPQIRKKNLPGQFPIMGFSKKKKKSWRSRLRAFLKVFSLDCWSLIKTFSFNI